MAPVLNPSKSEKPPAVFYPGGFYKELYQRAPLSGVSISALL